MSRPCWSCCVISAPLTPCWGAVWLRSVPARVGEFSRRSICSNWSCWQEKWTHVINPVSDALMMDSAVRFDLRAPLRSPAGVWDQLFCDLPPTWQWLPRRLWAFTICLLRLNCHCLDRAREPRHVRNVSFSESTTMAFIYPIWFRFFLARGVYNFKIMT